MVFLLRGLRSSVPTHYLKVCYFAFFQSILLYGLVLWGGAADVTRVLRMQKRAIRTICGAGSLAHCRPLFIGEKILTVYALYIFYTLCRTHSSVDELVTRRFFHTYETRGNRRLDVPYLRLSRTRTGLAHLSTRLFNKLPLSARDLPAGRFQRALKGLLVENPLYSLSEFFMLDDNLTRWVFAVLQRSSPTMTKDI